MQSDKQRWQVDRGLAGADRVQTVCRLRRSDCLVMPYASPRLAVRYLPTVVDAMLLAMCCAKQRTIAEDTCCIFFEPVWP